MLVEALPIADHQDSDEELLAQVKALSSPEKFSVVGTVAGSRRHAQPVVVVTRGGEGPPLFTASPSAARDLGTCLIAEARQAELKASDEG